jgi:hypothetical protein
MAVVVAHGEEYSRTMKAKGKAPDSERLRGNHSLRYSVTIEATFGSALQRDVGRKALDKLLASWKDIVEAHHKKNRVKVISTIYKARPDVAARDDCES